MKLEGKERDLVNEFLADESNLVGDGRMVRETLVCKDGTELSIQASHLHYSFPKSDKGPYDAVEVLFEDLPPFSLRKYVFYERELTAVGYLKRLLTRKRTGAQAYIAAYVPVEKVNAFIRKHGGIA